MQEHETKKLDQIIIMLADMVATFGGRFDTLDEKLLAVENKLAGIDRRLDAEAIRRSELKLTHRVHALEEHAYGKGRSRHPKHLPL